MYKKNQNEKEEPKYFFHCVYLKKHKYAGENINDRIHGMLQLSEY